VAGDNIQMDKGLSGFSVEQFVGRIFDLKAELYSCRQCNIKI
jgi:hypothetical protein